MKTKYIIKNEKDMQNVVVEVLSKIKSSTSTFDSGVVLALNGDLGTGKTTFTKALAQQLCITEHITSPTFVIQKTYTIPPCETSNVSQTQLVHIDAYRLNGVQDTHAIDLKNTVHNPGNLVIIEWADLIKDTLPEHTIYIYFTYINDTTREVVIDGIL